MEKEILFEVRNHIGFLTLNRPAVLNALSYSMIRCLTALLQKWARDDSIYAVMIKGAGGKAFCAGGDESSFKCIDGLECAVGDVLLS